MRYLEIKTRYGFRIIDLKYVIGVNLDNGDHSIYLRMRNSNSQSLKCEFSDGAERADTFKAIKNGLNNYEASYWRRIQGDGEVLVIDIRRLVAYKAVGHELQLKTHGGEFHSVKFSDAASLMVEMECLRLKIAEQVINVPNQATS